MIKQIAIFLGFTALELIKRFLSFFFYPIVYLFRNVIRSNKVIWKGFLLEPKRGPLSAIAWFFLDDSIFLESGEKKKEYSLEPNRLGDATHKTIYWFKPDWLRAWQWSAVRNSCVNWNNWCAYSLGKFDKLLDSWGMDSFAEVKKSKFGYRLEYRKYANGNRLYLEFNLFHKWQQIGWLQGEATRFEIDAFKDKS